VKRKRAQMSNLGLDRGRVCRWLRTRHTRGIAGSLTGNNPIHALTVRLLRLQPEPELLAHHGGQEGAHRVRLPAGGARDGGDGGAARPAQQCQPPRLLRIRSPLALTAAGRLRTDLGCRPRLGCAQVCAWTCKTPLKSVGATAPEGWRKTARRHPECAWERTHSPATGSSISPGTSAVTRNGRATTTIYG